MRKINYKKISSTFQNMVEPTVGGNRSSVGDERVGEYFYINIEDLIPFKKQARTVFDEEELASLSESIRSHGIRQPLTIIPSAEIQDKYEVVSGERRLRAAILVGLKTVPCIVIHDYQKAEEIALIENLHREDLHPVELGVALNSLLNHKVFNSQSEMAMKLSISKTSVSELVQLSRLDEEVQEYLIKNNITLRDKLRKISTFIGDSESQKSFLGMITEGSIKEKVNQDISIVRISMKEGRFSLQNSGIKKLNSIEKASLKKMILLIAKDL